MKTLILKVTVPDDFTQEDVYKKYDRAMNIVTLLTEEDIEKQFPLVNKMTFEQKMGALNNRLGAIWAIDKIKNYENK